MGQCCANKKEDDILSSLDNQSRLMSKEELEVLAVDSKPVQMDKCTFLTTKSHNYKFKQ